ncbi:MAG: hypothetical protein IT537_22985 [Hyphomicrobiales bacterium]|nr:hypothetical protein [Hyphomicrobiales bacterium]
MSPEARPACVIVTSLEDAQQLAAFSTFNLPSLLADSNLPAFVQRIDTTYTICAPAEMQSRLRDTPLFRRLAEVVHVDLAPLGGSHRHGSAEASTFSLPPDAIWSAGALRHLASLLVAGRRTIFVNTSIYVAIGSFRPALASRFGQSPDASLSITARELARLGLEHVHPACADGLRAVNGDRRLLLEPIADEGAAMVAPDLEPIIHSPRAADAGSHRPSALTSPHYVTDSDDVCVLRPVTVAPPIAPPGSPADAPPGADAVVSFRLHFAGTTASLWRRAERRLRISAASLLTRRAIARLADAAGRMGCPSTAELLTQILAKGLPGRVARSMGPFLFLLPNEAAVAALRGEYDALLAPINTPALVALLRAHCVRLEQVPFLYEPDPSYEVRGESGERLRFRRASRWLLEDDSAIEPHPLGQHRVAVVDTLQRQVELAAVAAGTPAPEASAAATHARTHPAPPPRLEEPERALEALAEALRQGARDDALEPLIASVRFLAVAATTTGHMYEGLGWPLESYRGFDHLPERLRSGAIGEDRWAWHREALRLPLTRSARVRLQLDLLANGAARSQVGTLPREVQALLSGQHLHARARYKEAAEAFARAVSPTLFLAPALRQLGLARWRSGKAHLGAVLLDTHLRLPNGTAIDPRVPKVEHAAEELVVRRGTMISVDGNRFSALTVDGGSYVPTETVTRVGNSPLMRSIRQALAATVRPAVYRRMAQAVAGIIVRIDIARRRLTIEVTRGQSIERLLLNSDRPAEP